MDKNFIYGKLNSEVTPVLYKGLNTNTAQVVVNKRPYRKGKAELINLQRNLKGILHYEQKHKERPLCPGSPSQAHRSYERGRREEGS